MIGERPARTPTSTIIAPLPTLHARILSGLRLSLRTGHRHAHLRFPMIWKEGVEDSTIRSCHSIRCASSFRDFECREVSPMGFASDFDGNYREYRRRRLYWKLKAVHRPWFWRRWQRFLEISPWTGTGSLLSGLAAWGAALAVLALAVEVAGVGVTVAGTLLATVAAAKIEATRKQCLNWIVKPHCRSCAYDVSSLPSDLLSPRQLAPQDVWGVPSTCPECGSRWPTVPPEPRCACGRFLFATFP